MRRCAIPCTESRYPELVEPVPRDDPGAGLRNVSSLLMQLGMSELKPLRRNEMEWVFGLTGGCERASESSAACWPPAGSKGQSQPAGPATTWPSTATGG
jgi:hypothetical protein